MVNIRAAHILFQFLAINYTISKKLKCRVVHFSPQTLLYIEGRRVILILYILTYYFKILPTRPTVMRRSCATSV